MMYFKKRYCRCCGGILKRKRTERVVRRGDSDDYLCCNRFGGRYDAVLVIGTDYYCPACDKMFYCDEQSNIICAQKHFQRKIVSEKEICFACNKRLDSSVQRIKKHKWLFLIPIIGLLLTFLFMPEALEKNTNPKDKVYLISSPFIVFICVAGAIKLLLSMYGSIQVLNDHQRLIMLIPALLSSGLPIFWYINHKFK